MVLSLKYYVICNNSGVRFLLVKTLHNQEVNKTYWRTIPLIAKKRVISELMIRVRYGSFYVYNVVNSRSDYDKLVSSSKECKSIFVFLLFSYFNFSANTSCNLCSLRSIATILPCGSMRMLEGILRIPYTADAVDSQPLRSDI